MAAAARAHGADTLRRSTAQASAAAAAACCRTAGPHLCGRRVGQLNVPQGQLPQLRPALAAQAPARHAARPAGSGHRALSLALALAARHRVVAVAAGTQLRWVRAAVLHVQGQGRLQGRALALLEGGVGARGLAGRRHAGAHRQLAHHHVCRRGGAPAGVGQHAVGRPAAAEGGAPKEAGIGQAPLALGRLLLSGGARRRHQALRLGQRADGRGAGGQQWQACRRRRAGCGDACRGPQRRGLLLAPRVARRQGRARGRQACSSSGSGWLRRRRPGCLRWLLANSHDAPLLGGRLPVLLAAGIQAVPAADAWSGGGAGTWSPQAPASLACSPPHTPHTHAAAGMPSRCLHAAAGSACTHLMRCRSSGSIPSCAGSDSCSARPPPSPNPAPSDTSTASISSPPSSSSSPPSAPPRPARQRGFGWVGGWVRGRWRAPGRLAAHVT